jgi:hypothetical protein
VRKLVILSTASLALCAGAVQAQYPRGVGGGYGPGSSSQPYSPYLNLLRANPLGAAGNYYGLVRPELSFRESIGQLGAQQAFTSAQQTALQNTLALPPTGHATGFFTHTRYFLTAGAGGFGGYGGGGGGGGGVPAGPAPGSTTPASGRR